MVGWFALNVPSGLALYYLSNTLVTTAQQVYLRKLGGANVSDRVCACVYTYFVCARHQVMCTLCSLMTALSHMFAFLSLVVCLTLLKCVYLMQIKVNDLGPVTRPGSGRRTGVPATDFQVCVRWCDSL